MADEDVKKIQAAVKDQLRPLKDLVEVIKNKVDHMATFQSVTMDHQRNIRDQQSVMNEKMDEMRETLDSHTASLMTIEREIKAYADMYKINNSNGKKLEKRIEPLENQAGITPPPELALTDVD